MRHSALRNEYQNLSIRLTSETEISSISQNPKKIKAKSLWDTGAMMTAITPETAQSLNLVSYDRKKVKGIKNEITLAGIARVSIKLPNIPEIKCDVLICSLVKDIDLLIGMDIIQLGDFSISNGKGKTLFTFVMPPFEDKTDLYDKAITVNNSIGI